MIPYDVGQAAALEATAVVIERAERHIDFLATDPPVFPSPMVDASSVAGKAPVAADAALEWDGSYQVVRGTMDFVPSSAADRVTVVAVLPDGSACGFDPFWVGPDADGDAGDSMEFMLYVPGSQIALEGADFRVYAG